MNQLSAWLLPGSLFIILGIVQLCSKHDGVFWGVFVPRWIGWLDLAGGGLIVLFVIRGLLRGEGKQRPYTEKDVAEAKRCLEQMHLQEHGTLPEYPDAEEKGRENGEKLKQ